MEALLLLAGQGGRNGRRQDPGVRTKRVEGRSAHLVEQVAAGGDLGHPLRASLVRGRGVEMHGEEEGEGEVGVRGQCGGRRDAAGEDWRAEIQSDSKVV